MKSDRRHVSKGTTCSRGTSMSGGDFDTLIAIDQHSTDGSAALTTEMGTNVRTIKAMITIWKNLKGLGLDV